MKTPYVQHTFGEAVEHALGSRLGWLTAGVASSITWPSCDVCIRYANDEYFLRGTELKGKPSPPGITVACDQENVDDAISKVYRLTSVLSWYFGGYVDVSGYLWSNRPILYGNPRTVYSTVGIFGEKSFNCNHMPVIEHEYVRKALAFWREGKRLNEVHNSYAFLSYYKVIESQFLKGKDKGAWITANIDKLTGQAAQRIMELRVAGIDVSSHLYESGRCAVAHASFQGEIVDPDIPTDRRRLSADLIVMEELARIYIRDELKVPDLRSLYRLRDRLDPWKSLLPIETLDILKSGGTPVNLAGLQDQRVSIGLWPDGITPGLESMVMHVDCVENGIVKVVLINERKTILLVFLLDYQKGLIRTNLQDGGLLYDQEHLSEIDVKAYATFFYKVLGNSIAELSCRDFDPIDCEVVIPVNIIPPDPEKAIEAALVKFREEKNKKESI